MIKSQLCAGQEREGRYWQWHSSLSHCINSQDLNSDTPLTPKSHRRAPSRMEFTRSIHKATNNVSNSPAQMHAHHPVGALQHTSTAFASPFSTRSWVSVPIDHRRRRM